MVRHVFLFFAFACVITWGLDAPGVLALVRGDPMPPFAMALGGLGAFGPALAAVIVAAWFRGPRSQDPELVPRSAGPLRAFLVRAWGLGSPIQWRWALAGLVTVGALHQVANLLELALGGHPARWFYPPTLPPHVLALVFFSVGEELGWRGFAYPRLARRWGPVQASLLIGVVWGVWHLGMSFDLQTGALLADKLGIAVVELALYSVIIAWFLERSGGGVWLAIAIHAGAHLDNVNRAPDEEVRLRILRVVVVAAAAGLAAWGLSRRGEIRRAT